MTAEVGSILGYLKLDRSDWDAELRAASAKADELGRNSPNIKIGTNAPTAIAQLAAVAGAVRRLQDAQGAESVAQSKLSDLQSKGEADASKLAAAEERVARAHRATSAATIALAGAHDKNDQAMARAEADASKLAASTDKLAASSKKSADKAKEASFQYRLLADSIALVGPAVSPILGATAGAALGLTALGAAGYLAFGGIKMEMQNASALGQKFAGGLGVLGTDLQTLQETAAGGVLKGFEASVTSLNSSMPSLNTTIAVLSTQVGSITAHTMAGFVALIEHLQPLFVSVGQVVDALAAKFEHWAQSSSGISSFVAYAQAQLPHVITVITSLVEVVGHLLQGLAPLGSVSLTALGALSAALAAIPVDVLRVLVPLVVSTYTAFRVYSGINALLVPVNTALIAHAATVASTSTANALAVTDEATAVAEAKLAEAQAVAAASAAIVASTAGTASLFQAEAVSAGAAAEEITASWAGTTSLFATDSTLIAEAAAEQVVAYQAAADAAIVSAEEIIVASKAEAEAAGVAGAGIAAMLGPLAAVAVGVTLLTMSFSNNDSSARANAQSVSSFTDALIQSKGAIDATVQSQIIKQLTDSKAISDADALGLSTGLVYAAVTGNKQALDQVNTATEKYAGTSGKAGQVVDRFSANINQMAKNFASAAAAAKVQADAVAQTTQALSGMTAAQRAQFNASDISATSMAVLGNMYGITAAQAQNYAQIAGITAAQISAGNVSNLQVATAIHEIASAYDNASQSGSAFLQALSAFSTSAGTAEDHAKLLGAGLVAMQGDALGTAGALSGVTEANKALEISFEQQTKQKALGLTAFRDTERAAITFTKTTHGLTASINTNASGAHVLVGQLQALQTAAQVAAEATYQHVLSTDKSTSSTQRMTDASQAAALQFKGDTYDAIIKDARALGLTHDQAVALATQYFKMPKNFTTTAHLLGTGDVVKVLNGIGLQLSYLTHHPWVSSLALDTSAATAALRAITSQRYTINVAAVASGGVANLPRGVKAKAAGGTVTGSGGPKADNQLTWLSVGEEVTQNPYAGQYRGILRAINTGNSQAVRAAAAASVGPTVITERGGAQMPSTLVIIDVNGQLIGRMQVEAQNVLGHAVQGASYR